MVRILRTSPRYCIFPYNVLFAELDVAVRINDDWTLACEFSCKRRHKFRGRRSDVPRSPNEHQRLAAQKTRTRFRKVVRLVRLMWPDLLVALRAHALHLYLILV